MLGDNIKKFRLNQNLTQEELGQRLSVTRQAISNWERGKVEPDLETLHAMAAVFHVSLDTLIHGGQRSISLPLPAVTDIDKEAFSHMIRECRTRFAAKPSLQQIIAVRTARGNTYYQNAPWEEEFWTPGDFRCEEAIITCLEQAKDTQVCCMVVMWNDGKEPAQPNPASWLLAQRLLELDARNMNTLVLLWLGVGDTYCAKPLHIIAPPSILKRFS